MKTEMKSRKILIGLMQVLLISLSFVLAITIPGILMPFPDVIEKARPASGFTGNPLLWNTVVNALLVFWLVKRSPYKGMKLFLQISIPLFFVQTFQTQIETLYFIDAFPLLKGNFEAYKIILRGLLESVLFSSFAVLVTGRLKITGGQPSRFVIKSDRMLNRALWLGAIYVILYVTFGYFVAWQSQELRLFYGGPARLNTYFNQLRSMLLDKPDLPFFQYCRGLLWIAFLIPIFKGFTGGRKELIVFSALYMGLMPTVQLAFANPLMPPQVCFFHFIEVSVSNAIFGALTGYVIPVLQIRRESERRQPGRNMRATWDRNAGLSSPQTAGCLPG